MCETGVGGYGNHGRKTGTDNLGSRGYGGGSAELYRRQDDGEVRSRLHGLWLLRSGWGMEQVAQIVGVHYRTVQRWVSWYRQGGVAEVCARHGGGHGQSAWLTPTQEAAVV